MNYSTLCTPPSHFSPELKQIIRLSQSPSIYDSARIKTIASSQEKRSYVLDYRDTLSSPKIRKMNEKFNSCYCWTLFDYCHICVSGLCSTHQTIKCSGECERIFHVSCTDINKIDFSKNFKTNDSSCIEIYSSVDKVKLLNTTWLCAKCKYTRYNMIETPNVEDDLIFEKKCLNVGLLMSSKISIQEKKTTLKNVDLFLSKLHVNCSEYIYNNIINNPPKPYPSSTRITESNSQKHALYGRRFETSMLCYNVSNCDCCGKICITHDDNLLQKEIHIINRSHLSKKIHKVWKCCCSNICSGQQFYCPQKPSQMNFYKLHHESKDPWKFLKLKKKKPNASICDFCYKDVPENTGKYVVHFFLY